MRRTAVLVFTGVILTAGAAQAQMGPIPGEERFQGQSPNQESTGGVALNFASYQDFSTKQDFFLELVLKNEINLGKVGLGFQIPLRLRVWDPPEEVTDDYGGYVPREDWDEISDFPKIIRYVRLGNKRDDFYLRVGELSGDIGHGTIMSHYINNVDPVLFRVGSAFDINTEYGGIETITSDVGTIMQPGDPNSRILGTRLYLRPMAIIDPSSLFNIISVGTSVISDTNAPRTYVTELGADGVPRPQVVDGQLVIDKAKAATVFGFDLEAEVLNTDILKVIPYTDLNFIQHAGWGWHAGVLTTFSMPVGFELTIPVRLEYRNFASDYIPGYFGTFYEIERYNYALGPDTQLVVPKRTALKGRADGDGLQGYYGDVAFDFAGIFQVGAIYEDYINAPPELGANLAAFMSVPALEWIQFKAYYARTNIQGTDDILKLDGKSLAIAEARYEVVSYVFLVGRVTQRWVLETEGQNEGDYHSQRDYKFGVEMSFTF